MSGEIGSRGGRKNTFSRLHWHRLSHLRHVRDGCHVLGPRDADLERGFQRRLVEARKRASRIRWLELSRCDPSVTRGSSIQADQYEE